MSREEIVRALRRAVYTHKLLSLGEAKRYCELVGVPYEDIERAA